MPSIALTVLKKFISFVGQNWKYLVLVTVVVQSYFLFSYHRQTIDTTRRIDEIQQIHQREMEEIQKARDEETKKKLENERVLNERLAVIQGQYETLRKEFDETRTAKVKEIVKKYGDDPEALAKKMSETLGFEIVKAPEG
jgi:uncharacterized membrane protein (DUF106 family)